jgi:hypothetical protein
MNHHRTIEELAFHMLAAAQQTEKTWAKGFVRSIVAQSRSRNWKPSPKQIGVMRRLVADLFTEPDDFELIEE